MTVQRIPLNLIHLMNDLQFPYQMPDQRNAKIMRRPVYSFVAGLALDSQRTRIAFGCRFWSAYMFIPAAYSNRAGFSRGSDSEIRFFHSFAETAECHAPMRGNRC